MDNQTLDAAIRRAKKIIYNGTEYALGSQEELDETAFVTPEKYGAVGDGVHDDAPALQAALRSGRPVKVTQDLYLFSPITVEETDVYFDGQGFTLHLDGVGFQDLSVLNLFINFFCRFKNQPDCDMAMVTETAETEYSYHRGYVAPVGVNPTPGVETYQDCDINTYYSHSITFCNVILECVNVGAIKILNFDRYCHGLVKNVIVDVLPGHDAGGGIGLHAGYDFHFSNCFVNGCAGLNTDASIYHSVGSGLSVSGTNITVDDCVLQNCRAELQYGAARSFFDCNIIINNVILSRSGNYTIDRLFDIHGACYNSVISNVIINLGENMGPGKGQYAILWRCKDIQAYNIRIDNESERQVKIVFGEFAENVCINGLYADRCDLFPGGDLLKQVTINNGSIRRVLEYNDSSAMLILNNVIVRELARETRNMLCNNCKFLHDIDWNTPTIETVGEITLRDCEIHSQSGFRTASVPIIKAARKNSINLINCKVYTQMEDKYKIFNLQQNNIVNLWKEDILGITIGTDKAILGINNLF